MRYIDYGTMQSEAQRRVLEMQRKSHEAVYSTLPEEREKTEHSHDIPPFSEPKADISAPAPASSRRDPEETLIAAVLALLLSEDCGMFPILALLYLLM